MAQDESMMFPNERIKNWLTSRAKPQASDEVTPVGEKPALDESANQLDASPPLEAEP